MSPQLSKMADDLLESVKGFVQRSVDMDAAIREAALDRVDALVKSEREALAARVAEKIEAHLGG